MILRKSILLLLIFTLFNPSIGFSARVKVRAEVIYHPAYKGGAAPPPEVLERCCSPRPFADKALYLKKNYYSEVIYKITTDSSGKFEKCMKPGVYRVYLNNEIDKQKAEVLSSGKIDQENAKKTEPYFTMEVTKDGNNNFTINIYERINTEIPPP